MAINATIPVDGSTVTESQLLAGIANPADRTYALEILEKLLHDKHQWQDYLQLQENPQLYETLAQKRRDCVKRLESMNSEKEKLDCLIQEFKPLSTKVARLQRIAENHQEDAESFATAVRWNLKILHQLVVESGDNNNEPLWQAWKKKFLGDKDLPEEAPKDKSDSNLTMVLPTKTPDELEACHTCGGGNQQPFYRCVVCGEVQCPTCHQHFHQAFHSNCIELLPGGLNVVEETVHPCRKQTNAAASPNLARAVYKMLETWGDRPCFCSWEGTWLTYRQLLKAVLQRVTILRQYDIKTQVIICFPTGSMNFYLWDLACLLAGVTSIGMHVPSPPPEDWPVSASHFVCEKSVLLQQQSPLPNQLVWINATIDEEATPPFNPKRLSNQPDDPDGSLWTKFLTSGTTGRPKLIPETRATFIKDNFDECHMSPLCVVSYLPHCWGTDRGTVYLVLCHGGRVGFAPCHATLPQLVEAMEFYQPNRMSLPPAVSSFLLSLPNGPNGKPPSNLGGRLERVFIGSSPVPSGMPLALSQKYGIPHVHEGYGITEVGGIATDGWFYQRVLSRVKLRDPQGGEWLDPTKEEGVVGELWIGGFNTKDIVELTHRGKKVRVIGRSSNATSFKLPNGKWCALVDIEDELARACCPDLFDEVMVWCNRHGVLVMLGSTSQSQEAVDTTALLKKAIQRTNLQPERRPKALLLTDKPLPRTITLKVQRGKIIQEYQEAADRVVVAESNYRTEPETKSDLDIPAIAARILGAPVDPTKSFVENGGDSMLAIQLMQQVRKELGDDAVSDWRALLNNPLEKGNKEEDAATDSESLTFDPPLPPNQSANHVLLTGATGFFGGQVLKEILQTETETIVVCLVREGSRSKIQPSDRVLVVTEVPTDLDYKSVIHCAANVDHIKGYKALKADNVDLTAHLLRQRLAPMIYCSTWGTHSGVAPFADGYTQSKWVSEQMVRRSGGQCFWPPFLVWGNSRDWLTRLLKHCLRYGRYPAELGFVAACPVDVAARDLLAGKPCSVWDLDLSDLFLRLRIETGMQPTALSSFVAELQTDPKSPAYPYLPLLLGKDRVGDPRSPSLYVLPIDWQTVWPMIRD